MFWIVVCVGVFGLMLVVHVSYERGARPLKKLKPWVFPYCVMTLLYHDEDTVLLVLYHHEGQGHYRWRIAHLPRRQFNRVPDEGEYVAVDLPGSPYKYTVQ